MSPIVERVTNAIRHGTNSGLKDSKLATDVLLALHSPFANALKRACDKHKLVSAIRKEIEQDTINELFEGVKT